MPPLHGYIYLVPIASFDAPVTSPLADLVADTALAICGRDLGDAIKDAGLSLDQAFPERRFSVEAEGELIKELARLARKRFSSLFHKACTSDGQYTMRFHAAPLMDIASEYARWGLDVIVDWTEDAVALPHVSSYVPFAPCLEESFTSLWDALLEHDAEAMISSLSGPALGEVAWGQERLGAVLPEDFRALYAVHNGQLGVAHPFFAGGHRFLSVSTAVVKTELAIPRFKPDFSVASREEQEAGWFCFARSGNLLVTSLASGRIYELSRQVPPKRVASSLSELLRKTARSLHDGSLRVVKTDEGSELRAR